LHTGVIDLTKLRGIFPRVFVFSIPRGRALLSDWNGAYRFIKERDPRFIDANFTTDLE
jgi:hypothetical protein